jgi:DNA-binding transcriptional regulator YiaG
MKEYHYTESGLDNIYLVNGFEITPLENGGEEIFIHDLSGLHKAIGLNLIFKQGPLSGKEVKFIRTTLDFSQKTLGKILGCDYQTVLLWEKDSHLISKSADHLLKVLFYSYLHPEKEKLIFDLVNEIAELDAEYDFSGPHKMQFREDGDRWKKVA